MKTIRFIFWVVIGILVVDVFGLTLWIYSGQVPADNFYLGTITAHIIGLMI